MSNKPPPSAVQPRPAFRARNPEAYLPVVTAPSRSRLYVGRDMLVVAAITLATFLTASSLELSERLQRVTRPLERFQADELSLSVLAFTLSLLWFAWRRWRQADTELGLRVATQETLIEREAQYRLLFTENLAGTVTLKQDGTVSLCNAAMAKLLGLPGPDAAMGRCIVEFYASREVWERQLEQALSGPAVEVPCLELLAQDRRPVQAIARLVAHRPRDGAPWLQLYCVDITELQLMQKELSEALASNRLLAESYLLLQEEERRELARELHDDMGQCMNAIKLDAVAIRDHRAELPGEVLTSARSIIEVADHVYDVARGLIQRLRPVALDELGLEDALHHLVEQWRRRNGAISCTLEVQGDLRQLGERVNITLYRMAQECLTNITRHAQATNVQMTLTHITTPAAAVVMVIRDDGVGNEDRASRRTGLGLVGLRERVEGLGGELQIARSQPHGWEVKADIPISLDG